MCYSLSICALRICHVNMRSLTANFNNFGDYVRNSDYHVVAFTETWLNYLVDDDFIPIEGYTFQRLDRAERGAGLYTLEALDIYLLCICRK